jgi:hypothetical protein
MSHQQHKTITKVIPNLGDSLERGGSIMCSLKIRHCLVVTLCMLCPLFCAAQEGINGEAAYISFSVPGALGTYPMSINASMTVTGYYLVSPTVVEGFVQDADGIITTFKVGGSILTEPESINSAGEVTGLYETVSKTPQGFLRYADGRIITFDYPSSNQYGPQAQPVAINDFGEIAGNSPSTQGASEGFTRSRAGVFNGFGFVDGSDYPTTVTALNGSGIVVGYFDSYDGPYSPVLSSFILHADGYLTEFDVPVDVAFPCNLKSISSSVNTEGVIAGWYEGDSRPSSDAEQCVTPIAGGFVRSSQGAFTLFQAPGPIVTSFDAGPAGGFLPGHNSNLAMNGLSLNQAGTITGSYTDTNQAQHGFVRNPYGTITSFDPPRGKQTTATSINDSGVIVGSYFYDWNTQIAQGFLRLPKP